MYLRTFALCAALLVAGPARAVDINLCSIVADGRAEIVSFSARMADGTAVTLDGILAGPAGAGPFPAIVMLPGGHGLRTPYCYRSVVERLVGWGYVALIVAGTTARDSDGRQISEYSFADLARYAHGAAAAAAKLPPVDPPRIGLWGHSHGGLSAIEAVSHGGETPGAGFRAAVAAAPVCPARAVPITTPLLLVIGDRDADVPVSSCVDFAAALEGVDGFEFQLLSGAGHLYWISRIPGYDQAAAMLAEARLKSFLARHLLATR